MRTIVCFRTGQGDFAVPVEDVTEVRSAVGLIELPAPAPGVVGLLRRGEVTLPVLAVLGATGRHIVVIDKGTRSFGLLVEEVTGVRRVEEARIGDAPLGQDRALVTAVMEEDAGLVLFLDVDALAAGLSG